jgi:hypothetical protein
VDANSARLRAINVVFASPDTLTLPSTSSCRAKVQENHAVGLVGVLYPKGVGHPAAWRHSQEQIAPVGWDQALAGPVDGRYRVEIGSKKPYAM